MRFFVFYIFLCALITLHFWAPMFEQLQNDIFNIGANSKIYTNIVPVYVLLFDFCDVFCDEWFPCGIGVFYYINVFKFYNVYKKNKFLFSIYLLGIISSVFCFFNILWKIDLIYNLFNVIQFPWRFYIFSSTFFIIGFSIIFKNIKFNNYIKIFLIYTCLIFLGNSFFAFINPYIYAPLEDEIMFGEYLPKDFNYSLIRNYSNKNIQFERNDNILYVDVINDVDVVELPLIYYKGYKVCDNECFDVYKTNNGLVGVSLNKGVKKFRVWYNGTNLYNVTKYLSAFGFVILIYIIKKFH